MYHFLYRLHELTRSRVLVSARFTVNPAVTGSSPCFSQKLFRAIFFGTVRLSIFFGTVRLFFDIFLSPKGPPFKFFDILQQTEVSKSPKGPPFLVFRHYETVSKISFFVFFRKFFQTIFIFFKCLQRVPLNFFDILQQTEVSKSPKGSPSSFRHCETVSKFSFFVFFSKNFLKKIFRKFLSPKSPPFIFFDILQQTGFSKFRKSPPLTNFKNCGFLSLRYSADFRRSRLVISISY